MGQLNPVTRTLNLSNAGCPFPYHFQRATGKITELQIDAYPLGVRPETEYEIQETQLETGGASAPVG